MDATERVPERLSEVSMERHRTQRVRHQREYIKGPIPVDWVRRVLQLSTKAIAVALALVYKAGVSKSKKDLPMTPRLLERFGVCRRTGRWGLRILEEHKLVTVERRCGRSPRVTILDKRPEATKGPGE